jgi:hypothetical protein
MDSSLPAVSYRTRKSTTEKEKSETNHNAIGLDTAKHVFHIYRSGDQEEAEASRPVGFFRQLSAKFDAMKACGDAHHWA